MPGSRPQARQGLILVGNVNDWSVKRAKQSHCFAEHDDAGRSSYELQVWFTSGDEFSFQVIGRRLEWEWCLYPAAVDGRGDGVLKLGDPSAVAVGLSLISGGAHGQNFRISEDKTGNIRIRVLLGQEFQVWYEIAAATPSSAVPRAIQHRPSPLPSPAKSAAAVVARTKATQKDPAALAHAAAARGFAELLLRMREGAVGGQPMLEGLRQLFQDAQDTSGHHESAVAQSLLAVADGELANFGGLADIVLSNIDDAAFSNDTREYAKLFTAVDQDVAAAVADTRIHTDPDVPGNWMNELLGRSMLSLGMIFVHLPLVMYVHNSLHLYEMLTRLNSVAPFAAAEPQAGDGEAERHRPHSDGPRAESDDAEDPGVSCGQKLRAALDSGGLPYSWMVFAVTAALQVLFRVRWNFLVDKKDPGFPLPLLLASNPGPPPGSSSAHADAQPGRPRDRNPIGRTPPVPPPDQPTRQAQRLKQVYGDGLMFRGLWVPSEIDEDRSKHQYSFNSFSRTLDGALSVLEFYGRVLPVAAKPDWHVLLLIGVGWPEVPWVTPVQFFAGPGFGDVEKELVIPPYMFFDFEDGVELRSGMPTAELEKRALCIARRWRLKGPKEEPPCGPGALDIIGGPNLARLLGRDLGLFRLMMAKPPPGFPPRRTGPRVTVRFISRMFPRPAIRELFTKESLQLLRFPPAAEEGRQGQAGKDA